MCTHNHYIYNKYIHQRVLVPCGRCPECRQRAADARAFRIRNSYSENHVVLMVTLTYDNDFLPFIYKHDFKPNSEIKVYRYVSTKNHRDCVIGTVFTPQFDEHEYDVQNVLVPRNHPYNNILAVPFYKDVQNFFKRLRINLYRAGVITEFKYYSCCEIGPTTFRPHFHLALVVERTLENTFRDFIVQSWPYANENLTKKYIQRARDCASYLASYVNRDSSLPEIFSLSCFKQKHSYSQGFGMAADTFSLPSLLSALERNDLSFNMPSTSSPSGVVTVPFPKYVISRYFPIFKGYSRIPPCEVHNVLQRVAKLPSIVGISGEFSEKEIAQITTRIKNASERYLRICSQNGLFKTYEDYFIDFERVWRCYHSTMLRLFYAKQRENGASPVPAFYDNIIDAVNGLVRTDLSNMYDLDVYTNYNKLPDRVLACQRLSTKYFQYFKRRKVVNYVLDKLGANV